MPSVDVNIYLYQASDEKPWSTFPWLCVREKADDPINYQQCPCKSKPLWQRGAWRFSALPSSPILNNCSLAHSLLQTLPSSTRCLNRLFKYFHSRFPFILSQNWQCILICVSINNGIHDYSTVCSLYIYICSGINIYHT